MMPSADCPCGSGLVFDACCRPLLAGSPAATAEALMRSRYVAYVLKDADYLRATWQADACPVSLSVGDTAWLGLRILHRTGGGMDDDEGTVGFVAAFRDGARVVGLHEVSRFVRVDGRWFYVDGQVRLTPFGRNDPCPCGSGRKLKRCCGRPTASPSS